MAEPRMEIKKVGRWRYELTWFPTSILGDDDRSGGDWIGFDGGRVWGRKRAERVARRRLKRLSRKPELVAVIRPADAQCSARSAPVVNRSDKG